MEIIIIGCGMIGYSHLKSFFNLKHYCEIDLIDKKEKLDNLKKIIINRKNIFFNFKTKIPINKVYDFAIISTNSKERYSVFKELVLKNKNKVNFFLLEKFIFAKINHYKKFYNLFSKYKKKIMINSFGNYIFKKSSIRVAKNSFVNITIKVMEGTMFTSMIHYLDFFYLMTKKRFEINISKISKIINSKRSGYFEGVGEISAKNSNGIVRIISSQNHILEIKIKVDKTIYILNLKMDKFQLYKKRKIIKEFPFPFAFNTTIQLVKNKNKFLKNFDYLSDISIDILKSLKKNYNKEIFIT